MNVNRTDDILNIIFKNIQKDFNDKGVTELSICFENILKSDCTYVEKMLRKMRLFELLNIDYYKNRILYDGDAIFFSLEGDENVDCKSGDVLVSFWTPFSRYIDGIPNGGRRNGAYCKTYFTLSQIIEEMQKSNKLKEECLKFEYLAENYWSRGNLLYFPSGKRNGKHNMNADRFFATGVSIEDKVDQTLYHCFQNEVLADYFDNDNDTLINWIYSEHLECMFIDGFFEKSIEEIQRQKIEIPCKKYIFQKNIQQMIKEKASSSYVFSECGKDKIGEYIDNANKVIAYRNKCFAKE